MSVVLAPTPMDPAGLRPLSAVVPALLDASADRPQSGEAPITVHEDALARILQGDSARLVEAVGSLGANLIITSPPYSLGVDYGQAGYADDQPYADYLNWVQT